jgi:hypothetical protein
MLKKLGLFAAGWEEAMKDELGVWTYEDCARRWDVSGCPLNITYEFTLAHPMIVRLVIQVNIRWRYRD